MNIINPMLFAGLPPELISELKSPKPNQLRPIDIDRLIELEFNVSIEDLKSKAKGGRERELKVIPRQMWHYLLRKHTNLILSKIGERTNRNHATVLHSLNKVTQILEWEKDIYHERFTDIIKKAEKL